MSQELKVEVNDLIEGFRAQRAEALDSQVQWFAKFVAASKRIEELEAEVAALQPKRKKASKPEVAS